jgi:hypothetical protein
VGQEVGDVGELGIFVAQYTLQVDVVFLFRHGGGACQKLLLAVTHGKVDGNDVQSDKLVQGEGSGSG